MCLSAKKKSRLFMVKMLDPNNEIPGLNYTFGDYWAWAYSDILSNVNRGVFAEFLVAKKLGVDVRNYPRMVYDCADIRYGSKTIQVKSSAYVQSWHLLDFSWNEITENKSDNKRLYEFLKQYYHIDWVENAIIKKDKNKIELGLGKEHILLSRIDEKKFSITYGDKKDTFEYKNWEISKIKFNVEPKRLDDSCKIIPDIMIPDPNGEKFAPDCYVLCLYEEKEVTEANVLDISKWKFYVIKTPIKKIFGVEKKNIYESDLKEKELNFVGYDKLKETIDKVLEI